MSITNHRRRASGAFLDGITVGVAFAGLVAFVAAILEQVTR